MYRSCGSVVIASPCTMAKGISTCCGASRGSCGFGVSLIVVSRARACGWHPGRFYPNGTVPAGLL